MSRGFVHARKRRGVLGAEAVAQLVGVRIGGAAADGVDVCRGVDPPDLARVRDTLATALDKGPLRADAAEAPVTVSGGILRLGPVTWRADPLTVAGSASVDLRTLRLDARALLAAAAPPGWVGPAPQATVTWKTGRTGIERDIDVATLTNVLTTRAVARELERIEATTGGAPAPVALDALGALARIEPRPTPSAAAIAAHLDDPGWQASSVSPFTSAARASAATFTDRGSWRLGAPDALLPSQHPVVRRAEELRLLHR